jgi:hypothetical protein
VSPPACCACVWQVRTALVRRGGRPAAGPGACSLRQRSVFSLARQQGFGVLRGQPAQQRPRGSWRAPAPREREPVRRRLTGTDRRGGFIVNHRSKLKLATDMPDVLIRRLVIAIGPTTCHPAWADDSEERPS